MSRYIVIGAGALGALLAAQWTIAHVPVTLVARGRSLEVLGAPTHEYTRALLDAVPGRALREVVS